MRSCTWTVITWWIFLLCLLIVFAWGSAVVSRWPAPVLLTMFGALVMVLGVAILVVRRRRQRPSYLWGDPNTSPATMYLAARDDAYFKAHRQGVELVDACALACSRQTGRLLGEDQHVTWTMGKDDELDQYAKWLVKHGPANGVYIEVVE